MAPLYDVSAEAQNDPFEIWRRIADDNVKLANRIEGESYELFASLGRTAVLRGRPNIKRILQERP